MLRQPVESVHVKRYGGQSFQVGVADMVGWRKTMEDAHAVHTEEQCAFFGVFDGHGGSKCSDFVAESLKKHLKEYGLPKDDAAVEALMLDVDEEFLNTSDSTSGSTGTFAIIEPGVDASKRSLRVGNIGDSRALLGRMDGTMVPGPGTDSGLTVDHKPDSPSELDRIVASGNHVTHKAGIPRINGNLAVSRSFGDVRLKIPRDCPPEKQCVCAKPDLLRMECDHTDFLVIVCDGISEGTFPNSAVVSLAAEELQNHADPGKAATAVCRKALMERSTDNLTCMIVLLQGSECIPQEEFLRGPLTSFHDSDFMKAYMNHYDVASVSCPIVDQMRSIHTQLSLNRCNRVANIPSEEVVRNMMNEHTCLSWDSRFASVCNMKVKILMEDPSDGTSKVCYGPYHSELWVPTALLAF